MTQVSIILAHPDPKSFNHAIAQAAADAARRAGCKVTLHDLCAERFDPLLPAAELKKDARLDRVIEAHCAELRAADGLIFVHPNWWGQPPAMLKGWLDRVVRAGVAYEFVADDKGEGVPRSLLRAKFALVFNTSNTPPDREEEVFHDPLQYIWKDCVFGLCPVQKFARRTFSVVVTSTLDERKAWLKEAGEMVEKMVRG